jgi:hypothetical protein
MENSWQPRLAASPQRGKTIVIEGALSVGCHSQLYVATVAISSDWQATCDSGEMMDVSRDLVDRLRMLRTLALNNKSRGEPFPNEYEAPSFRLRGRG